MSSHCAPSPSAPSSLSPPPSSPPYTPPPTAAMTLDKDKLAHEMSTLPLSAISTSIAASSTSTAAATSSSLANSTTNYAVQTHSLSTTNPGFLGKVITGAVNNVLSNSRRD